MSYHKFPLSGTYAQPLLTTSPLLSTSMSQPSGYSPESAWPHSFFKSKIASIIPCQFAVYTFGVSPLAKRTSLNALIAPLNLLADSIYNALYSFIITL